MDNTTTITTPENREAVAYDLGTKHIHPNLADAISGVEKKYFWRGLFLTHGDITYQNTVSIQGFIELYPYLDSLPVDYALSNGRILFSAANTVEFLGWIFDDADSLLSLEKTTRDRFSKVCKVLFGTEVFPPNTQEYLQSVTIKFKKHREDAVIPTRAHPSDTGFDLTLIDVDKVIAMPVGNKLVTLYETGISVEPPPGYYFDVVPRSSIMKTGYILANSVGVIDRSYRGTIKVPLMKLDYDMPNLTLPFRAVQLIPRRVEHFLVQEVDELTHTTRSSGGFGSTNG